MTYLFHDFDGHSVQEAHRQKLKEEISNLSEDQLRGTSLDEWIKFFEDKYGLDVPVIDRENVYIDIRDTKLDARKFRERIHFMDGNRAVMVDGNQVVVHIPYTGDKDLFRCSGNRVYHNSVNAQITATEVLITQEHIEQDAEKINSQAEKDISFIEGFLSEMRNLFGEFNRSIRGMVEERLSQRLEKFRKDEEMKSKLKFPIRQRDGASTTFKVPEIRRKVAVTRPVPKAGPQTKPEPVLEDVEYNHILKIMQNMAVVMEKSPHAFQSMGEEDLRQHFLVQLNGQYEGTATGETFNYEGKTDILIKYEGKTIFIAECKYWTGPKTVSDTIDQILGYTSWRDTKTAILLFNKNKSLSGVLSQIPELVGKHSQFEKQVPAEIAGETEFRFIFKNKDDDQRKLNLTVLVFDVPR
ncbi:MAG: hypothetical protein HUU57_01870 [Bdellovibrio sp.]|nr:hypothetical protein [Bdellovibrio sp.]